MQFIEPKVYLIAETKLIHPHLAEYLKDIGAYEWIRNVPPGASAETLSEIAGRLCYNSFAPGLNPNVTKVTEGNDTYLGNIIKQRHGSIYEHSSVTFIFRDVSRVFCAELCRHRAGVAISQESLRYVRLTELKVYFPEAFQNYDVDGTLQEKFKRVIEYLEIIQTDLAAQLNLDDRSFSAKKLLTSAMRRLAPLGLATNIMWSCNMRALRHVIEQRTSPAAEEEIRKVFDQVALIVTQRYPNIFQDFDRADDGTWIPDTSKV